MCNLQDSHALTHVNLHMGSVGNIIPHMRALRQKLLTIESLNKARARLEAEERACWRRLCLDLALGFSLIIWSVLKLVNAHFAITGGFGFS